MKDAILEINRLSPKGNGRGTLQRPNCQPLTVEVPFTMPGDRVHIELMGKKKGTRQGKLLEIVDPAPGRIDPKCQHFGTCGGCRWQHVDYQRQLRMKQSWIASLFEGLAPEAPPILACDPPWNYRNKMEYSFSQNAAGDRFLGLVMEGGRRYVMDLEECHLVDNWFIDCLQAVRAWWDSSGLAAFHPYQNTGALRSLTVREGIFTGDRMVVLTVSGNPDYALSKVELEEFRSAVDQAIAPMGDGQLSIFLRIQQAVRGQPTQFYEMCLHGPDHYREVLQVDDGIQAHAVQFKVSPAAFFQPNPRQAQRLYGEALKMAQIGPGDRVLDLYCGTGALGLCAAAGGAKVWGIEISPEAVVDARENIKLNGLTDIEIREGDAGKELEKLLSEGVDLDVVMVDPPRAGLDPRAVANVLKADARRIVYVSCNPVTQAENVEELMRGGYRVLGSQAVDQFPHTAHVENVVVLEKV